MIYDIGIIGAGVAGSFSCLKIAKNYPELKVVSLDIGRAPAKRRRQIEGFLGCLPNSDGKLYLSNIDKVSDLIGIRKSKSSFTYVKNILSNIADFEVIKDSKPSISLTKKINKAGFEIHNNDYIQMFPKQIHELSKFMVDSIEQSNNIDFKFDTEVVDISKQRGIFTIITSDGEDIKCKKLIIAVGRSGWRWAHQIYKKLGIVDNNDFAKFGIRVEMNSALLKDFNQSCCTLLKDNVEIGPFSWYGSVIPEDHLDLAISAFRGNEGRWETDKVSFQITGDIPCAGNGVEQTDRIGKLTFIIANDRILKEKVSTFMNNKSKISIMSEYNWLKPVINDLSECVPDILNKSYFHFPTILPMASKIILSNELESEVSGMYVLGESAGLTGLLSAMSTGSAVVDFICK